jgi:hypothetical protein
MSVRVTAPCRAAYNFQVIDLDEGEVIPDGELADYLAATGAPVESVDKPGDPGDPPVPPAVSATKAAWVEHAVAVGADQTAAEAMTKAALVEAHGTTTE